MFFSVFFFLFHSKDATHSLSKIFKKSCVDYLNFHSTPFLQLRLRPEGLRITLPGEIIPKGLEVYLLWFLS